MKTDEKNDQISKDANKGVPNPTARVHRFEGCATSRQLLLLQRGWENLEGLICLVVVAGEQFANQRTSGKRSSIVTPWRYFPPFTCMSCMFPLDRIQRRICSLFFVLSYFCMSDLPVRYRVFRGRVQSPCTFFSFGFWDSSRLSVKKRENYIVFVQNRVPNLLNLNVHWISFLFC